MTQDPVAQSVTFKVAASAAVQTSDASCSVAFILTDRSYGLGGPWTLGAGGSQTIRLDSVGNWYDFTVTAELSCGTVSTVSGTSFMGFWRTFMGRVETGKASITDPAMGKPALERAVRHPAIPAVYRLFDKAVPSNPRFRPSPRSSILKPRALQEGLVNQVCAMNKDACVE
jgi:hypothetical protein